MSDLVLHVQDASGLKKTISKSSPIPVVVRGLDDLPEAIASRIGTHIIKPPDVSVATPAVTVEPPAVTVEAPVVNVTVDVSDLVVAFERQARLFLYGCAAFGVLQIALMLVLIFVR